MPYSHVPTSGQSLGVTRDPIRNNFLILEQTINENHVAIDAASQGNHGNVIFSQVTPQLPTDANDIEFYNKDDAAGLPQIWMVPQNTLIGDVATASRQLTAGDITEATFGTNAAYTPAPTHFDQFGGWTFLAGNIVLQYGHVTKTDATAGIVAVNVGMPLKWSGGVATPNIYSVSAIFRSASDPNVTFMRNTTFQDTFIRFTCNADIRNQDSIYWMAIGQI